MSPEDRPPSHDVYLGRLVRRVLADLTGEWVGGCDYYRMCKWAGLDLSTAARLRAVYAAGALDRRLLAALLSRPEERPAVVARSLGA